MKALAVASWEELRHRHLGKPFRTSSKIALRVTGSAGWAATLGNFAGYQTSAEVWIDKFTGHDKRKVYYALVASKKPGLERLTKGAKRDFGEHMFVTTSQWDQDCDYSRLAKQLAKARFGRPVYECYPENEEYYYGVYEFDQTGLQRNKVTRFVERVADFFQTITETFSQGTKRADYDVYRAVENRQSVIRHVLRERNSHAATLRKQKDDYVCRLCRFDFAKVYGKLGDDFAEAHHIIPLKSNQDLRSTAIEDLVTVCSNCHRMLHRMSGAKGDIARLRRIVKQKR